MIFCFAFGSAHKQAMPAAIPLVPRAAGNSRKVSCIYDAGAPGLQVSPDLTKQR